jgi:hypothetical protein
MELRVPWAVALGSSLSPHGDSDPVCLSLPSTYWLNGPSQ